MTFCKRALARAREHRIRSRGSLPRKISEGVRFATAGRCRPSRARQTYAADGGSVIRIVVADSVRS
jgi:hypothetical protein